MRAKDFLGLPSECGCFNRINCVCGFSVYDNFEVDTLDGHHSIQGNYVSAGIFQS